MYVAKLETKTNLYLGSTAKLVSEEFPKAVASLGDFNEAEEGSPCLAGISTS